MNDQKTTIDLNLFEGSSSFFGQTLLRDVLIPNLLGNETNEILYWAGKELARQYPLGSAQDTILFFERAGFGTLALDKRGHNTIFYRLTGTVVESRIKTIQPLSFNLEAGFLAEQIQQLESNYTEAIYEIDKKTASVLITVRQDLKDTEIIEKNNPTFILNKKNSHEQLDSLDESTTLFSHTKIPEESQLSEAPSIFEKLPSRSSKHKKNK